MKFAGFDFCFGPMQVCPTREVKVSNFRLTDLVCNDCKFTCPRMFRSMCGHIFCDRCVQPLNGANLGSGSTSAKQKKVVIETFCISCFERQKTKLVPIPESLLLKLPCACSICNAVKELAHFGSHLEQCIPPCKGSPLHRGQVKLPEPSEHSKNLEICLSELHKQVNELTSALTSRSPEATNWSDSPGPSSEMSPRSQDSPVGPWTGDYVVKLEPSEGFSKSYITSDIKIEGAKFFFAISESSIFLIVRDTKDSRPLTGTITVCDLFDVEKSRQLQDLKVNRGGELPIGASLDFGPPKDISNVPHSFRIKVMLD